MMSRHKHLLDFVVSLQGQLDLPDSVGMGFDCKRQEMKLEAVCRGNPDNAAKNPPRCLPMPGGGVECKMICAAPFANQCKL